jgi:GMP synthase-like glutamine amidotransferase
MAMAELGLVELPDLVHVLQSHGDAVHTLPPGAELLASSPDTEVEMFTIEDRIMGIQGHPEFAPELLKGTVCSVVMVVGAPVISFFLADPSVYLSLYALSEDTRRDGGYVTSTQLSARERLSLTHAHTRTTHTHTD